MKHWARQRAILLLLALVVAPAPAQVDQAAAERDLTRIRQVIATLEQELKAAREQRGAASRALEAHERAIAGIAREQRQLDATARDLDAELARLRSVHQDLLASAAAERQALGRQLRVAYALGREDRLKLLLQRRDPGEIARLLRYHGYFTRERRERLHALDATITRLTATQEAITRESARLDAVRAQQAARRDAMLAERAQRAQALVELDAELGDRSTRLARLEKDREQLAQLLKRLREAITDIPVELEPPRSFAQLRGRLPWPVSGPIAQRFGAARAEDGPAWQGVVLAVPAGREVRAVAHGRVVFADWLRGFGQMVILDHGGGYMSLYGHNQSLLREPGEWVSPGDVLATVGDSGGNERAGLYFEIRHEGRPQDPARWCSTRARFAGAL